MKMKVHLGARELVELGRACGPGQILRKGYTRKDGTYIAPDCVKDQGAPGRTPASKRVLPAPKPGTLKGWKAVDSADKRHAALKKAVKAESCRAVISRLTLEHNFTYRTSPRTARIAAGDAQWLHNRNFCKLKTKK